MTTSTLRLERNLTHSVAAYAATSAPARLCPRAADPSPDGIAEATLSAALGQRRARASARSRARMLSGWRGSSLPGRRGGDRCGPAEHDSPKIGKALPSLLSEDEVRELLDAPDRQTAWGLRDVAMLELLYATGLRVSELVGTQPSDINLARGLILAR